GDRVFARAAAGGAYAPATIAGRKGDDLFLQYDEGSSAWVPLALVRVQPGARPQAARGATAAALPVRLEVGERVLACWHDLFWYPGVVVSVNGRRLHILFDDGDQAMVTPDKIKPLEFKPGDRVCTRRGGGPIYYPGEITRINGEVIHVNYDDGEE